MTEKKPGELVVKGFAVFNGRTRLSRIYHCESAAKQYADLFMAQGGVCEVRKVVGVEHFKK